MKKVTEKLSMLAHRTNAAIVILHHARKKKRSEYAISMSQHDSVGAGVLNRLVGCMIGIEKKAGDNGQDIFTVRSLQSWLQGFSTFSYTLEDETDEAGREWVRMKIDLTPAFDKNAKDHIKHIIMENYADGKSFTRQDIMNLTGLSHTSVSQVLKVMVGSGELSASGSTRNKTFCIPFNVEDDFLN